MILYILNKFCLYSSLILSLVLTTLLMLGHISAFSGVLLSSLCDSKIQTFGAMNALLKGKK